MNISMYYQNNLNPGSLRNLVITPEQRSYIVNPQCREKLSLKFLLTDAQDPKVKAEQWVISSLKLFHLN